MPFLLSDMSDSLGQLVVVPDDRWDDVIALLKSEYLNTTDIQFVETDQGPFIYIPDGDVKDGIFVRPTT